MLYRSPTDSAHTKDRLDYYLWLAKLAEKGKITSIFFADSYAGAESFFRSQLQHTSNSSFSVDETFKGNYDATYRGGSQVAQLDPTIFVSAMASVTKSLSFGITGSTSYIPVSNNSSYEQFFYSKSLLAIHSGKDMVHPRSRLKWQNWLECRY